MAYEMKRFSNALKSVARNQDIKKYIQQSEVLFPLFMAGVKRFGNSARRFRTSKETYSKWTSGFA